MAKKKTSKKSTSEKRSSKKKAAKKAVRKKQPGTARKRVARSAGDAWVVHVVSDASGNLARHMTRTMLMGFEGLRVTREFHVFQDTPERIRKSIATIDGPRCVVVHALVHRGLKRTVEDECAACGLPCLDLTGPFVEFMERHTGVSAVEDLSRIHTVSDDYFKRVDAIEFSAEHDDGRNLGSIHRADVVIVGLSRVSKSPTSYFLGSMGIRTANVSIVREVGFPRELDGVTDRIVALTLQPKALADVRQRRMALSGIEGTAYTDLREVIREVMWAEGVYRDRGYRMLDITGRTIEETVAQVCRLLGLRGVRADI